jgi:hypothetical protein
MDIEPAAGYVIVLALIGRNRGIIVTINLVLL